MSTLVIIIGIKFPVLIELRRKFVFDSSNITDVFIRFKIQYQRTDLGPEKMIRTAGSHRCKLIEIIGIDKLKYPFVIGEMTDGKGPPDSPRWGDVRIA